MAIHTFACNKLVRNKTINRITTLWHGTAVWHRLENDADYVAALMKKMIEEADEVARATSREELVSELADALQVIEEIAKHYKITEAELHEIKDEKVASRGGYDERVFCEQMSVDESSPIYNYYATRPEEYPEIKQP
jgi:predicted house-cleaning noncanonical NTP pyrophosphatase (MazG superfamily)